MKETAHITIDAAGQTIGRVASRAALALRGKTKATFERHIMPVMKVTITNAGQLKIDPKKLTNKLYKNYSGYPGGLKETSLAKVIEKKGFSEPLRHAIKGMLPANKLRAKIMHNITIHD